LNPRTVETVSGPAGFYSRNPANEVIQGTEQKVRNGRNLLAGPAQGLLEQPEGVFEIEAAQERL